MAMEQSVAVKKFVARIKPKYIERRLNHEKQWPPCSSEKLVRLELVEGEQRQGYSAGQTRGSRSIWNNDKDVKRSPLAYSDILKAKGDKKIVRKVLVEGDAGIGKTTLCTAISEDWANETLFQEFEILLLLHLRQKRIATAGSLLDLLKLLHPSQKVCELVKEYIEEQEGKVLIIADGWDELGTEDRSEGSFLYELLFDECYSLSVIVTSRPYVSAPLHKLRCIDRLVEVHGFSKENIKEFIQCEFASDRAKCSGLLEQLEGNPLIESVCSIPLNCAIVCHLWHYFNGVLPTTMSELYTKIILNIILRNVQKILKYGDLSSLPNFDALPESLKQPWSRLCNIAFLTLSKDKIVFSHEDIKQIFQHLALDEEIFGFGLLQSAEPVVEVGCGLSFHFLHLTIQEYLAALYVVRQSPDVQLTLIQSHISLRFEMVWRFFFGISCTVFGGHGGLDAQVSELLVDEYYSDLTLMPLYHFGLEANQRDIDFHIASKISISKLFIEEPAVFSAHTAHDFAAVVRMISRIAFTIEIEFQNFDLRNEQIATLADALVNNDVVSVILHNNHLTDQGVADLFDRASSAFRQSLRRVCITNNGVGPKAINSVTTLLGESLLSYKESAPRGLFTTDPEFDISDNPLEVEGLYTLRDALCADKLTNLVKLSLAGSLTSDADTNAELILSLGSGHCHNLEELNLSRNNLGEPGGKALGKVLACLHSGVSLHLDETMLGDEGISAFAQNIEGTCEIGDLQLDNNGIHAAGLSCLAECVCAGKISPSSIYVSLANNPLGLEGVTVVLRMLNSCNFLSSCIDLSSCQLTTSGRNDADVESDQTLTCVSIAESICCQPQLFRANSITKLYIDNVSFSGDRISILKSIIYMCPRLDDLQSNNCGISSNDLEQLLIQLSELNMKLPDLESWELGGNNIGDVGASTLIQHLSKFPRLEYTRLDDNNQVSPGMLEMLEGSLAESFWDKCIKKMSQQPQEIYGKDMAAVIMQERERIEQRQRNLKARKNYMKDVGERDSSQSTVEVLDDEGVEQLQSMLGSNETTTAASGAKSQSQSEQVLFQLSSQNAAPEDSNRARQSPVERPSDDEAVDQLQPTTIDSEEITRTDSAESKGKPQSEQELHLSTQVLSSTPLTLAQWLNKVLDFKNVGVSKHLGQIADSMYEWEGAIAEQLELTRADIAAIKAEYPGKLKLQTREALELWKQRLGSDATYNNLIRVFENAGYRDLADFIRKIAGHQDTTTI